jgi:hypothetical protein
MLRFASYLRALTPMTLHLAMAVVSLLCCDIANAGKQQVVLLRNGSVFHGQIARIGSMVVISSTEAKIRLPKDDVLMVTDDLPTAYHRQAKLISRGDTSGRIRLIQWCLRHNLRAEAARELTVLRAQAPRHPQLPLLTEGLARPQQVDRGTTELPAKQVLPSERRYAQEALPKLSKQTLTGFTRQVHPLLVNRCALAGCHGRATESSYQLSLSRWTGSRAMTESNLGATLKRVGPHPPEQTLLWMSTESPHGQLSEPPLSDSELAPVRDWITRVARELHGQESVHQRSAVETVSAELVDESIDPFDPARFNSQNTSDSSSAEADPAPP